jgi:toxin ParE1/3/4
MACRPGKSPARGRESSYRQTACDDVIRQFRYYLVSKDLPEIASRFRDAVRHTIESLRAHPRVGAHYRSTKLELQNLRSWPVAGFEAIRIYYLADAHAIHVIRILHGKRAVKRTLEGGSTT